MASRVVISLAVLAVGASAAPFAQVTNTAKVCAAQEKADNHGCMAFCGYKAVQEDGRWACKQTEERVVSSRRLDLPARAVSCAGVGACPRGWECAHARARLPRAHIPAPKHMHRVSNDICQWCS